MLSGCLIVSHTGDPVDGGPVAGVRYNCTFWIDGAPMGDRVCGPVQDPDTVIEKIAPVADPMFDIRCTATSTVCLYDPAEPYAPQ